LSEELQGTVFQSSIAAIYEAKVTYYPKISCPIPGDIPLFWAMMSLDSMLIQHQQQGMRRLAEGLVLETLRSKEIHRPLYLRCR